MLFLALWFLGLFLAWIHTLIRRHSLGTPESLRIFILYQLVFAFVLSGLMGFLGHVFAPAQVAVKIGWPAHPQFQFELGAFELGYALAAGLGLWIRKPAYWLGMSIAPSVFLLFCGAQHLHEALAKGNFAPYNVLIIAPDFVGPLTFLGLLALLRCRENQVSAD